MERKYKMFRGTRNALIKNVDKLAREGVAATTNKKQEPRGEVWNTTQVAIVAAIHIPLWWKYHKSGPEKTLNFKIKNFKPANFKILSVIS